MAVVLPSVLVIGQMLVPAGPGSALIDFAVWMIVAAVGVWLGDPTRVQVTAVPIPYE